MEWLVLFAAIAIAVGAVVWLGGRAVRRGPPRPVDDESGHEPERDSGPRHYDVAAGTDGGDPADGGP